MVIERRITGPPGTGKTWTIAHEVARAAERYGPDRVLVTSLTRAAAHEAAGRVVVPKHNVGTLHHFGYEALGRPEIAETAEGIEAWNALGPTYPDWSWRFRLTADSTTGGNEEFDTPLVENASEHPGDRIFTKLNLARTRCLPRELWHPEVVEFSRCWERFKQDTDRRDFADLIDLAADLPCPISIRSLFVDEAQDMSRLEMRLVRRWAEGADTLTVVGDSDQAIFTWRGADPGVMWSPPLDPKYTRVLSQSYRVPREVHRVALGWIRRMGDRREDVDYQPRDADGVVATHSATWRRPDDLLDQAAAVALSGRTAMILATCSYMLEPAKVYLRKHGIPFSNPYRRRRGDWNPLYAPAGKTHAKDRILSFLRLDRRTWGDEARFWTPGDVWRWCEWLEADRVMLVRGAKAEIHRLADANRGLERGDLMTSDLLEWFQPEAVAAAFRGDLDWLEEHTLASHRRAYAYPQRVLEEFGRAGLEDEPRVCLSTIHGVKGGEADMVAIFPDLSEEAQRLQATTEAGRDALSRLGYVAMTRSRDELYLCRGAGGPALDWLT